ncbi:MAG: lipoate--protein ligase [Clostridia bacterium]|nr:lipoate--protein ligase [Christensenellaceae bacterium]MBR6239659.1 lipoate--protein ligase [Clostridia bacterium]
MKIRTYVSDSNNAWHNLAVDEFLLNSVGKDEIILYLYINSDSVIIGKNQNAWKECNIESMNRDGVKLVRRITGGGAVFHDLNNLNFSFISSKDLYDVKRQFGVILKALESVGLKAEFSSRNDLTINGRKFSGNAFCEKKHASQHHGTLLINTDLSRLSDYLNVSEKKIQSKGISSVRARVINLKELNEKLDTALMSSLLLAAFESEYGISQPVVFSDPDLEQIALLEEKHSSWEWRLGESPSFTTELGDRFTWGEIQIFLDVRGSRITGVKVFTDSLDTELSEKLENLLAGQLYMGKSLYDAVTASDIPDRFDIAELITREIP